MCLRHQTAHGTQSTHRATNQSGAGTESRRVEPVGKSSDEQLKMSVVGCAGKSLQAPGPSQGAQAQGKFSWPSQCLNLIQNHGLSGLLSSPFLDG